MLGKVKRLRVRGVRKSHIDISNAPFVEGDMSSFGNSQTLERKLELRDLNDQVGSPLIPPLHNFELVGIGHGRMLLRGEERPQGDDGPAYVQEWSVEVTR